MKYARTVSEKNHKTRVTTEKVTEVFEPPEGFDLADCFTPAVVAQFQECRPEVEPGWVKMNSGYAPPAAE